MGRVVSPSQLELQGAGPAWTGGTRGIERGPLVRMPTTVAECEALAERLTGDERFWLFGKLPQKELKEPVLALLDNEHVHGIVQSATSTGWNSKSYENQIRVFGVRNGGLVPFENRQLWAQAVVRDDQCAEIETQLDGNEPVVIEF